MSDLTLFSGQWRGGHWTLDSDGRSLEAYVTKVTHKNLSGFLTGFPMTTGKKHNKTITITKYLYSSWIKVLKRVFYNYFIWRIIIFIIILIRTSYKQIGFFKFSFSILCTIAFLGLKLIPESMTYTWNIIKEHKWRCHN